MHGWQNLKDFIVGFRMIISLFNMLLLPLISLRLFGRRWMSMPGSWKMELTLKMSQRLLIIMIIGLSGLNNWVCGERKLMNVFMKKMRLIFCFGLSFKVPRLVGGEINLGVKFLINKWGYPRADKFCLSLSVWPFKYKMR